MRFARFTTSVVAPLALLATLTLCGSANAQVSSGVKVATANPVKIFNELRETKDLRDKMTQDTNNAEKESTIKKSQLGDMKQARDQFKPGTKGYDEQNQKLMQATLELDTWGKMRGMQLANDQKIKIVYLYQKIMDGIAKVAAQKKIDLVLAEQKPQLPDSLDQVTADQLRAILGSQNILYGAATSDISSDVIAAMDAEYASGTVPAPAPAAGTGAGTASGGAKP